MPGPNFPLLEIKDLSLGFALTAQTRPGFFKFTQQKTTPTLSIIEGVSFSIHAGEWYGLVGESGCGKSITALGLMGLMPMPYGRYISGSINYQGQTVWNPELGGLRQHDPWQQLRGQEIAMIFQEPMSALNPLYTLKKQLEECFTYNRLSSGVLSAPEKKDRIEEVLVRVGLGSVLKRVLKSYPHELSGGMQQRVMIALALLLKPKLLIADEPTTALDVTIQAQIMELLKSLQEQEKLSLLFITHNLALMSHYADKVGVMYAGRLVEEFPVAFLAGRARHPYTCGLLKAMPGKGGSQPIPGRVPSPQTYTQGCRFLPRCTQGSETCHVHPSEKQLTPTHRIFCHAIH